MPQNVKGFVLYHDQRAPLEMLSREQKGELLEMLFEFSEGGESTSEDPAVNMAFAFISNAIKRDREQYEEKCEKSRESANKRYAQKKDANGSEGIETDANASERIQSQANASERIQSQADASERMLKKEKEKEKEKEKKESASRVGAGARVEYPADFSTFWEVYPRKNGKDDALKAWNDLRKAKHLPTTDVLIQAVKTASLSRQWTCDGGQYIPFPATWLRRGGWNDEPSPQSATAPSASAPVSALKAHNDEVCRQVLAEMDGAPWTQK